MGGTPLLAFFLGKPFFWRKKSIFWLLLGETPSFCYRFIPTAHRATPYCHLHQPQLLQNTQFGEILKTQDNFSSLEPSFPHRRLQTSAINSLENWEMNYSALKTLIMRYTDPVRAGKKPRTLQQIFSGFFFLIIILKDWDLGKKTSLLSSGDHAALPGIPHAGNNLN